MLQPGRQYAINNYRYGFNGKENDNEVKGEGNQQDYGMRIYDPRLGRFLSVDPISNSYPMLSPYQFASNVPIAGTDLNGLELKITTNNYEQDEKGNVKLRFSNNYEVETQESIRGVQRSTLILNIYWKYRTYFPDNSNVGITDYVPYKVEKNANSGLTQKEELENGTFDDKLNLFLYKAGMSIPGLGNLTKASDDRDPMTGEYKLKGERISNAVEGVLEFVTLGRSALAGKVKRWFVGWLIDQGVEKVINYNFKKLELKGEQETVLGYHIAKLLWEGKKGDIKSLGEWIIKTGEAGSKGFKFVEELKKEKGIDLNLPKDVKQAANEVLKSENVNNFEFRK